jgi:hypothetical protein
MDATTDGLQPDAAGPAVELTVVRSSGEPVQGLRVLFHAADATLVADVRTDAAGHASATIDTGGSVSLVDAPPLLGDREIRFVGGLTAGEQLTLALAPPRYPVANTSSFDVIIPADTAGGVESYRVTSRCNYTGVVPQSTAATYTIRVNQACAGNNDILVESLGSAYKVLRSFYRPAVAVTNGGTIDFSTATYEALQQISFAITNVGVPVYLERFTANGTLLFTDNHTYVQTSSGWTMTFEFPSAPVARELVWAGTLDGRKAQWGPADLSRSVDGAFPRLTQIASPTYDGATRTLSWSEGTKGLDPQGMITKFVYSGSTSLLVWHVFVPYGYTTFRFPQLPADLAELEPAQGTVAPRLTFVAGATGFEKLRRNIDAIRLLELTQPHDGLFTTDVLGTEGSLSLAGW